MGFGEAISSCFRQFATFRGRARRSEYWFFYLFSLICSAVAGAIDRMLFTGEDGVTNRIVGGLVSLVLVIPSLAVAWRRMHDIGRSGLWYLINLIPVVGWIIFIVWAAQDSHGDNQYGPSPKYR